MEGKRRIRGISFNSGPEEHLRSLLRGVRVKNARVILSSEKTILRFTKIPILTAQEINKAISFLYEENFPVDKDNYMFAYKILGKDLDRYSLLLAALPSGAVSDTAGLFQGIGVTIETLELFEVMGGSALSEFNPVLVFIKQETSWRVIWMKNKTPVDTWRVTGAGDINSLFAELDFGDTIDNALFYSEPEDWLVEACEEYGLAVSEALDADDIFNECGNSVNMLPPGLASMSLYKRILGFLTVFLIILSASMLFAAVLLDKRTVGLQTRRTELTARIRTLNDAAGDRPEGPANGFSGETRGYGNALRVMAGRLPQGSYIKHISEADDSLSITVNSGGGNWLNRYIDDCQSDLGLKIITSRITHEDGVTEIELSAGGVR